MKKTLVLALSLVLFGSVLSPHALASVKPGSKCSLKGLTKNWQGKKYTCIKSGKKLLWNKGVKVSTPASQPKQVQPIEIPRVERYEAVAIDTLSAKSVYGRSRQEVNDAIEKSNYVNTFLNFNIGPNQNPAVISAEKDSLNKAARLWSSVYQPKEQLEVLFYNFADLDWAKAKYTQLTGAASFHSAASCSMNYCGNASTGRTGNGPWIYEQGLGGSLWNKSTSAHEYTHLAQTSGNSNYWNIAPLWLVEGMAQFYGEAIGYAPFDSKLITRGQMHRQYCSDFVEAKQGDMKTLLEKNNVSTVKTLMGSIEFPNPRHQQGLTAAAYLLGSYASEVLVAVYGHSSVEQFIKSFATSTDWKSIFNKSFGISSDDFYGKLTPYLFEMSKEL
jgi:hypothetical protein